MSRKTKQHQYNKNYLDRQNNASKEYLDKQNNTSKEYMDRHKKNTFCLCWFVYIVICAGVVLSI
jgi:hypothetical protein